MYVREQCVFELFCPVCAYREKSLFDLMLDRDGVCVFAMIIFCSYTRNHVRVFWKKVLLLSVIGGRWRVQGVRLVFL